VRRPTSWLAATVLSAGLLGGGCNTGGCAAALLTGVLVRDGDDLIATKVYDGNAPDERLRWPSGYRLEERDGRLVAVDLFGTVKAGEGDAIRLGGGEIADGTWGVCGLVEVDAARS
jgi:hypothetical protein